MAHLTRSLPPMNQFLLLASTALVLLGPSACRKDEAATVPTAGPYFPNAVGNEWRYAVYDSVSRQASALTVRVVGTATLSDGQPATFWHYAFTSRVDTQYVAVHGDIVRAYAGRDARRSERVVWAVLPLQVGAHWQSVAQTSRVVGQGPVTTPAGSFAQTLTVHHEDARCCNYHRREDSGLAPGVGLVRRGRVETGFGHENSSWTLLSYQVAP